MVGLDNQDVKTIQGIVIPAEWDHDGAVLNVDIMSRDEASYRVENIASAKELLTLLQEEIMATGKIKALGIGKFEIRIDGYHLSNP